MERLEPLGTTLTDGGGARQDPADPDVPTARVHGAGHPVIRCAPAYTLNDSPREKPTSVSPASTARSTASDDGAETAASTGAPAVHAFCTSSNEARPLTCST